MPALTTFLLRQKFTTDTVATPKDPAPAATTAAIWRGDDVSIAVAAYQGDAPLDLSVVAKLTLEIISRGAITGTPVVRKELLAADLTPTISDANWQAGTAQHATFTLSATDTNITLPESKTLEVYWLKLSALTNLGKRITLGLRFLAIVEGGAPTGTPPPEVINTFYTASDVDTLLALKADAATVTAALALKADAAATATALAGKQDANTNLTAFAAKTAPTGAVVGTSDTQTLTNKSFTGVTDLSGATVYLRGTESERLAKASAVRETARAASAIRYQDGTEWLESWSSLSAWSASNVGVSGGTLVYAGPSGNPAAANRSFSIAAGQSCRVRAIINLAATGGTNYLMVGLNSSSAGASPVSGGTDLVAVGFKQGKIVFFTKGTDNYWAGSASAFGTYYVDIWTDATYVYFSIHNSSSTVEYRNAYLRSTLGTIGNVECWVSDAAMGSIGKVEAKTTLATLAPSLAISDDAPVVWPQVSGLLNARVAIPTTWDSRSPLPLCFFFHSYTNTEVQPIFEANTKTVCDALLAAGYAVASLGTGNDWGNQAALDAYKTFYDTLAANLPLGPTVFLSQSMGGLCGLLSLASGNIPNVAAWAGIVPVCNLANAYANASFTASINTAYSGDYATNSVGHDPVLLSPTVFPRIPYKFWSGYSDTIVPRVSHTDPMSALLAKVSTVSVQTTAGDHNSSDHFRPSEVVAFFNAAIGR